MKIEKNETYDLLGASTSELEWIYVIISDAIETKKFNNTIFDPCVMRDNIHFILYGDKK